MAGVSPPPAAAPPAPASPPCGDVEPLVLAPAPTRLARTLASQVEQLFPGYFSLVMATGAVSLAAQLNGLPRVARFLLVANLGFYAVLAMMLVARITFCCRRVVADLSDHARGPGFLTLVAATCILGKQLLLVAHIGPTALVLWIAGALIWSALPYAFLAAVIIRHHKPALADGFGGAWFLMVVATESVSSLGAWVAPGLGTWEHEALFFALTVHLVGAVLYLVILALVLYRLIFVRLSAEALTPAYWIAMGAVAITALAGTSLILHADRWTLLAELLPFLKGLTLLCWALATWLIPLLVALFSWRHFWCGVPLKYEPQSWQIVFPLGMYAICTVQLGRAVGLPGLAVASRVFLAVALAAWTLALSGLAQRLGRIALSAVRRAPAKPALVLAAVLGLATGAGCDGSFTNQGYAPEQPIAFSHAQHAGELKIGCLYCHFGAERSRHAGVPPANVCMNCHTEVKKTSPEIQKLSRATATGEPIAWLKVHSLPDHAFFSHARHLAGGVACQTCHGPVETMARVRQAAPLTMGWCLDCHRGRGDFAGAPAAGPAGTDCSSCHM
jgi:tellurite resistance protein TehA-like permease